MNQEQIHYMQEEKIDLRELFAVLKRRKKTIFTLTTLLTLLAVVYVFIKKPIYETKAVIETAQIGEKSVQKIGNVKQKLEFLYEVNIKGKKVELPIVSSINSPKKTNNILIIKTEGYSNEEAKSLLTEVVNFITTEEEKKISIFTDIQKEKLALITEDIQIKLDAKTEIKKDLEFYTKRLVNISEKDAALAGIYALELGKKRELAINLTSQISMLKNKRNDLQLSISPLHIKHTELVGEIELLDNPIKPKKVLIIVVAFITGLMLSVFLAFFIEFIQGNREEEKEAPQDSLS